VDTVSQTYIVRGRPSAMVGEDVNDRRPYDVINLVLFLCVLTALASSVVTAALCHRCLFKYLLGAAMWVTLLGDFLWQKATMLDT